MYAVYHVSVVAMRLIMYITYNDQDCIGMPLKRPHERTAAKRKAEGDDFERIEKGNYDDSFHQLVKRYLPDSSRFHRELDHFGVGDTYRRGKGVLPYFGLKGDLALVGLDLAEGGISYLINE